MPPRVAILGWGSLLWEDGGAFDKWHDDWRRDGPMVNLEFSRISASRLNALTLVIDRDNGVPNRVAWCLSRRGDPVLAQADLQSREGTTAGVLCEQRGGSLEVRRKAERSKRHSRELSILRWRRHQGEVDFSNKNAMNRLHASKYFSRSLRGFAFKSPHS